MYIVICSDESIFHNSGKVNSHNCCTIWGVENPYPSCEQIRVSSKVNVLFAFNKFGEYSLFFFMEWTINGFIYI